MAHQIPTIPGHGLQREGRAFEPGSDRLATGHTGVARCACGATSPVLETTAARRAWHLGHRAELAESNGTPPTQTGACAHCGKNVRLTIAGTTRHHAGPDGAYNTYRCPGAGQQPAAQH